ncbi:MAG: DNA polymerase III subunit delta [Pseudomonadota bacterium]
MKIAYNKINNFINEIPQDINYVLIFGPDEGATRKNINKLQEQIVNDDAFANILIDYDELKEDFGKLSFEMASMSMGGGRKFIHIYNISTDIPNELKEIIKNDYCDAFVVFSGKELSPRSSFRKFFETNKKIAAIACYNPEQYNLSAIIKNNFKEHNIICDRSVIDYLEYILQGADSMVIDNELSKVILYKHPDKNITLDDVMICCEDEINSSIEQISEYILTGNTTEFSRHFNLITSAKKYSAILILNNFRNYLNRIYLVKCKSAQGETIKEAMAKLKPPIFYKYQNSFSAITKKMTQQKIENIMEKITQLEIDAKNNYKITDLIINQLLYVITAYNK